MYTVNYALLSQPVTVINKFMKSDTEIIILLYWSLISSATRICPVQDIFLAV